jgi:hypothetical protein
MHRLTRDQFRMLVRIVIEDSGADLTRMRFNDAMLLLFESIPGLEQLPKRLSSQYLNTLWGMYQRNRNRRKHS